MRHAARIDSNQPAIVERLKAIGCQVWHLKKPLDLLVCSPAPERRTLVIEVKNPDGFDTITTEQAEFMSIWPGEIHIVRSPDEAVYAILGPQHCDKPLEVA
jgi:hypothetical protein